MQQRLLLALLSLSLPLLANTQSLIPNNLPTCANTCAQLQNAQSGCTPAGGAPVSNQQTYESCFCQSALLTSLYQQGSTLCTQCSASDNGAIASWYQSNCKGGGAAAAAGGQQGQSTSTSSSSSQAAQAPTSTSTAKGGAAATANPQNVGNNQDVVDQSSNGPWFSTHWQWVVMLLVLIIGLTAFAVGFSMLHKRYHRRREEQWAQSTVPHPDINTWGPGQSVHDFGVYRAAGNLKRTLSRTLSRNKRGGSKRGPNGGSNAAAVAAANAAEKGKSNVGVAEVHPMPPMVPPKQERSGPGFNPNANTRPSQDRSRSGGRYSQSRERGAYGPRGGGGPPPQQPLPPHPPRGPAPGRGMY